MLQTKGPLAHGGSHGRQHLEPQPSSEATPIGASATPAPEAPEASGSSAVLQPSPVSTEASPISLMPSIEGLPFGLGELSLGLVFVGPVGLFALRRWLQS